MKVLEATLMEDWLPEKIGTKEKNYLLDNITSVMTKL